LARSGPRGGSAAAAPLADRPSTVLHAAGAICYEQGQSGCTKLRSGVLRAARSGCAAEGVKMPLSNEVLRFAPRGGVSKALATLNVRAASPAWRRLRRATNAIASAGLILVALGTGPAHAVCEELTFQFFGGFLKLYESASQPCRDFVRANVANHAYRTTLVEVCQNKHNFSGRFRNDIYKQANKCLDKKSASWLRSEYSASATEQLRNWKGLTAANPQFCGQKVVRDYIETSQQILQQTRDQAQQYCH
jgi:hypothetical protein